MVIYDSMAIKGEINFTGTLFLLMVTLFQRGFNGDNYMILKMFGPYLNSEFQVSLVE